MGRSTYCRPAKRAAGYGLGHNWGRAHGDDDSGDLGRHRRGVARSGAAHRRTDPRRDGRRRSTRAGGRSGRPHGGDHPVLAGLGRTGARAPEQRHRQAALGPRREPRAGLRHGVLRVRAPLLHRGGRRIAPCARRPPGTPGRTRPPGATRCSSRTSSTTSGSIRWTGRRRSEPRPWSTAWPRSMPSGGPAPAWPTTAGSRTASATTSGCTATSAGAPGRPSPRPPRTSSPRRTGPWPSGSSSSTT